jgi:predicted oxidoreductase
MFYCQHAGQVVDWLDSLGCYPKGRKPRQGIYDEKWSVPRCCYLRNDLLTFLLAEHKKRVNRGYIEVLMNTTVTDLLQEEGKIVGVRTNDNSGTQREYRAEAVVACTGGFGSNIDLVRKYNSPRAKDIMSATPPHAMGEGLIMCQKVGAKLVNTGHEVPTGPYPGGVPDPNNPTRQIAHVNMNRYPGVIWVDLNGNRVVNEDGRHISPKTREALTKAFEQTLVVILDQKIMNENRPIMIRWLMPEPPRRSWEWFKEKADEGVIIKKANTIEELGRLVGVNVQNLTDTIAKYNVYVSQGEDKDFGRKELVYKIENPPFYAVRTGIVVNVTNGGPATNIRQQVLDDTNRVIPGLYAAGEVTGFQGFGTGTYNMGAFIFGKQAGLMAACEALSLPKTDRF